MSENSRFQVSLPPFTRRVLTVIGLLLLAALLVYFLWTVGRGLLVVFAALLLAIIFDGVARAIHRFTRLGRGLALPLAILVVAGVVFGGGWLASSHVYEQAPQLGQQLSQSIDHIYKQLLGTSHAPGSEAKSQGGQSSSTKKILSNGKQMIGMSRNLPA